MQQDKKIAELEEIKEFEKEKNFQQENELEIEIEPEPEKEEWKEFEMEIETSEMLEKKKRREIVFEMALFLILGILLGVTIKTEASKRITIGFNDYQISKPVQSYNVADLKKQLDDQIAKQQADQQAAINQADNQQQPQPQVQQ